MLIERFKYNFLMCKNVWKKKFIDSNVAAESEKKVALKQKQLSCSPAQFTKLKIYENYKKCS